jgi:hypothetical protein
MIFIQVEFTFNSWTIYMYGLAVSSWWCCGSNWDFFCSCGETSWYWDLVYFEIKDHSFVLSDGTCTWGYMSSNGQQMWLNRRQYRGIENQCFTPFDIYYCSTGRAQPPLGLIYPNRVNITWSGNVRIPQFGYFFLQHLSVFSIAMAAVQASMKLSRTCLVTLDTNARLE